MRSTASPCYATGRCGSSALLKPGHSCSTVSIRCARGSLDRRRAHDGSICAVAGGCRGAARSGTTGIQPLSMDIIPDKRKVVGLVEQAYAGKICLPNFQRDFIWTREEVADLVRSILRGYFIGSLLLLRCDPADPPFAPVFLRGAKPPLREPRPELLILDGQQRLSSLIYALT